MYLLIRKYNFTMSWRFLVWSRSNQVTIILILSNCIQTNYFIFSRLNRDRVKPNRDQILIRRTTINIRFGHDLVSIWKVSVKNFETASDDLYSFHRKVARENGIQLSGWSIINKYIYKQGKGTSPLYKHEFDVSIKDFCPLEDITTISDRFPISALLRDRTLVLTWDIETQSGELGEFAEVLDLNHNVFMICMTLHWKDDPKPLKQICLVDVETEPDPRWTTIICENQENLLKAFALCWRAFAPDIQVGFNDSDYDWRFIMERAYHLNILEWIWERMTGKFRW